MSARDNFTDSPAAAAAYEQTHGENHEFTPAFPLGSGNVPRLPIAPPCPECRAHKCGNCDGRTWDDHYDRATTCPCAADDHPRRDKFGES